MIDQILQSLNLTKPRMQDNPEGGSIQIKERT
jgi:hypothetical protein